MKYAQRMNENEMFKVNSHWRLPYICVKAFLKFVKECCLRDATQNYKNSTRRKIQKSLLLFIDILLSIT